MVKTDEEIEDLVGLPDELRDGDLVNVDGTKVKFHPSLRKMAEEIKKQSMKVTIPKRVLQPSNDGQPSTSGKPSPMELFGELSFKSCEYN